MPHKEYWSADRRFGLRVPEEVFAAILRLCARAGDRETGGILVGRYTDGHDCAVVTEATDAPADSRSGRTWFWRGIRGLQEALDRLWTTRRYYLGEWHFHPGAAPDPSGTDAAQMRSIAASRSYHCPEPILVIVGSGPDGASMTRVFVFDRNQQRIELVA